MERNDGCGRPSTKVTPYGPLALVSLRFLYQIFLGFLRIASSPLPTTLPDSSSQVQTTSALVKGLPSCHFTSSRSFMLNCVLSSFHDQDTASSGTILSALLVFSCGSKNTRLL